MAQRSTTVLPLCVVAALLLTTWQALAAPTPLLTQGSTHLARALDHLASALVRQQNLQELAELVAFPSISALPQHAPDTLAAAAWLRQRLTRAGMQHVAVLNTTGAQPIVYAHWFSGGAASHDQPVGEADDVAASEAAAAAAHRAAAPGAPTLLIYGHYDVQPVDPLDEWRTPPFTVTQVDGYLVGRGVDDDKGGVLRAIQAVEALLSTRHDTDDPLPPINIKFLLEGQEEIMSPDLGAFLEAHGRGRALLRANAVLSADGGQPREGQGGIPLGLRGVVGLEVEVVTAGTDMHSGLKGGSVSNPCLVLAALLASLHDADGRIAVEGFYDSVRAPDEEDRRDVERFGWDGEAEQRALGVKAWHGEPGFSPLERRWFRPTLDVVGMQCGFLGEGIKTVLPHRASAKLSSRLVPDQAPQEVLDKVSRHLLAHAPAHRANVTVRPLGGSSHPWSGRRDQPCNRVAARVSHALLGVPPLWLRDGATIPALSMLQAQLGLPATKWGWGLSENIHAPNERVKVGQWELGARAWVHLLLELAAEWRQQEQKGGGGPVEGETPATPAAKDEL